MTQSENTKDIVFDLNDSISVIIFVIKKRWKLLLLFYLLLLSITIVYNYRKKTVYQTIFTLTNHTLSQAQIYVSSREIIENFNLTYGEDGTYRRNRGLPAYMSNLKKIEFQKQIEGSQNNESALTLKMYVYEISSIDPIIKELITYCNGNNYIISKLKTEKEKIKRNIEVYKKRLDEMVLYKQKIEKENNNSAVNETYYYIHRDIASFQEAIANAEYALSEFKGFEVSVEPIVPSTSKGFSLIKSIIFASVLGIVFCPFLVFFLDKILATSKRE